MRDPLHCVICNKDLSKERLRVSENCKEYDGEAGWICDSCFCTQFEFYQGLKTKMPEWAVEAYEKIQRGDNA